MAAPITPEAERKYTAEYAATSSDPEFREQQAHLHRQHDEINERFFGGQLLPAHICFSRSGGRSLSRSWPTTESGARMQISISAHLVAKRITRPEWIVHPWPATGTVRFAEECLLKETVRQYVLEVEGTDEIGYGGYGSTFARVANGRVANKLGLLHVEARGRAGKSGGKPVAKGWPFNVRLAADPGYFGDDVTPELMDLATGGSGAASRSPAPDNLGFYEYILKLLPADADRAREVLIAHIDRLQGLRRHHRPLLRAVEDGRMEPDETTPLDTKVVAFDPTWLQWDNSIVAKMLHTIDACRAFGELAIMADALEDAGCRDGRILRHLRAWGEHTRSCWVLRRLRAVNELPENAAGKGNTGKEGELSPWQTDSGRTTC